MQVFNLYLKLLKSIAPFLCVCTVVFTLILFFNTFYHNKLVSGFSQTKEVTAIVNEDKDSVLVQDFIKYLGSFSELEDFTRRQGQLEDALFFRRVSYVIRIPYGFEKDFLAGKEVSLEEKAVTDSLDSLSMHNAVLNYLNTARNYLNISDLDQEELVHKMQNISGSLVKVEVIQDENANQISDFYIQYFNTISFIMTLCSLLGIGIIMISFRNTAIQKRNEVSPLLKSSRNLQLLLGNILFIVFYDIFFILLGFIMSPEKVINEPLVLLWLNLFIFSVCSLGASYIIIFIAKTKQTVYVISLLFVLFLNFIGGAIILQSTFGHFLSNFAFLSPVYWFLKANNTIGSLYEYDWLIGKKLISYMAIELGFAAVFFAISLVIGKNKRLQE